ncbi:hypothetical protein [Vibrio sp. MEBiC08052]|uniref:hypothetical protein n=1 Tax=Vibrio sp. MEBiC08052 TaxID=1761910 RepID=UPI0012F9F97C|nr:hypothetical protein [Vibrio sp. MEBiC08052]
MNLRDDGFYHFTCPYGHESIFLLQNPLFEILFEIGISAIVDEYYREAVSSFTSALERFYEVFIKYYSVCNEIDWEVIQKGWKYTKKSSERQLGAFVFLYMQEFKTPPPNVNGRSGCI